MAPSTKDTEKRPEEKKEQSDVKKEDEVVAEKPVELSVEDGTFNSPLRSCLLQGSQVPPCRTCDGHGDFGNPLFITMLRDGYSDITEILANIVLIGRAVSTIEPRFTIRVLRTLTGVRKKLNKEVLRTVLEKAYPSGCTSSPHIPASVANSSQNRPGIDR